ncbi:MAG: DNA-binding protein [Bacteroides sp.]|jgi:predicted histone-like DNA-binding protein|nr:DNA-binding protein [Bacteroides sp.]
MSVLFKKILRRVNPVDKDSAKKVYPMITYKYGTPATLDDVAKEISGSSGVSEGETISVLKDFRTQLKKILLSGRAVNITGLGYFYLAAHSDGTDKAEDFTASDINGLRICFRANKDIRITASGTTRSDGLSFKDVDRINDDGSDDSGSGEGSPSGDGGSGSSSGSGGVIDDNPLG